MYWPPIVVFIIHTMSIYSSPWKELDTTHQRRISTARKCDPVPRRWNFRKCCRSTWLRPSVTRCPFAGGSLCMHRWTFADHVVGGPQTLLRTDSSAVVVVVVNERIECQPIRNTVDRDRQSPCVLTVVSIVMHPDFSFVVVDLFIVADARSRNRDPCLVRRQVTQRCSVSESSSVFFHCRLSDVLSLVHLLYHISVCRRSVPQWRQIFNFQTSNVKFLPWDDRLVPCPLWDLACYHSCTERWIRHSACSYCYGVVCLQFLLRHHWCALSCLALSLHRDLSCRPGCVCV